MPNSPQISIITPTYNHEKFIGACIESAIQQTYENWEQIIIDDSIRLEVLEVKGGKVRIGLEAPPSVRIDRMEIYQKRTEESKASQMLAVEAI